MAQKRNFRMPEALSGLAERLGLKNGDENSPEAVIEANRKMGNEIAFCLRAIDFDRCAYKGQTPEDSAEKLKVKTAAMVKFLESSRTITDNISGINEMLLYAARAFRSAIADGDYNKAVWAKNALQEGILYLRDNVPEERQDLREQIIAARPEYLQHYKAIIQLYEKVDHQKRTVDELDKRLSQMHAEYDPRKEKIRALKDTPEGIAMYGNLKLHEFEPDLLNAKEKQFLEFIRTTALQAHNIYIADANRLANRLEYEQSLSQAEDVRVTIIKRPDVFNPELTAIHASLLKEQVADVAKTLNEYVSYTETLRMHDAALQQLLESAEAQGIVVDSLKKASMEKEEDIMADEAFVTGEKMAAKVKEAEERNRLAEEELYNYNT